MEFGITGYVYGEIRPTAVTFFLDGTARVSDHRGNAIKEYAGLTHAQAVERLTDLRIDWKKLSCAGFPQLPYDELKELDPLPPTPIEELAKIPDRKLRADAIKIRREVDEAAAAQLEEEIVS